MNEAFKKVADLLEKLMTKYNIPEAEMQEVAKACGAAIAQGDMDQKTAKVDPATPATEPAPDDELAGALGGRC